MAKKQLTTGMLSLIAIMVEALNDGVDEVQIIDDYTGYKIGGKEDKPELASVELVEELLEKAKKEVSKAPTVELYGATPGEAAGTVYGNKDKEKKHPFPMFWVDHIVIRESVETKVGGAENDIVEIPSSVSVKPFDAGLYKIHIKQDMFKGKKVVILHDPKA